ARIDIRKRCDREREVGIGVGARRTGAERGEPCEVSSCGRAVSCCSSDQQWWRTELELISGKSFDDLHRSTTLGATPKRVRFLSGGFRFDLYWNCAQCCEAQRQEGGASAVGEEAEVADANEALGEQM